VIKLLGRISSFLAGGSAATTAGIIAAAAIILAAIGAMIAFVLNALPLMPPVPDAPTGVKWLNWVVPLPALVGVFAAFTTSYVVFLGVRIIGRWVRAL
jgi:hypothetical protein